MNKQNYLKRIELLEEVAQSYEDWVEDNSYWNRNLLKGMLSVNVKINFSLDKDDVINFLKEKKNITDEFAEFLQENLTDDIVYELIDRYLHFEKEYLVYDWPFCAYEKGGKEREYADRIVDQKKTGLYGRSGGHYCFASVYEILDPITDARDEIESARDELDDGNENSAAEFIESIIYSLKDARDNIKAAGWVISQVENMHAGLERGCLEEMVYRLIDENVLDFYSEDEMIEDKWNYSKTIQIKK